jgi:hypothetical protein
MQGVWSLENLKVELATFLRMFAVQEIPYLMFFLGAGALARAGIPTAAEMVWMFKRSIYCTETGADPQAFRDLSVERYRQYLQAYFDNKGGFPPRGADTNILCTLIDAIQTPKSAVLS